MLTTFGFSPMWVQWILILISTTFFSIFIYGIPSQLFSPSRGIRQGDPISPFLFVLMVEGLGHHIKHALLSQHLKGLSIQNSPAITHQQFVDENMLFGYPFVKEASLSNDFSDASGTSINTAKSQIFFFHTPPHYSTCYCPHSGLLHSLLTFQIPWSSLNRFCHQACLLSYAP